MDKQRYDLEVILERARESMESIQGEQASQVVIAHSLHSLAASMFALAVMAADVEGEPKGKHVGGEDE